MVHNGEACFLDLQGAGGDFGGTQFRVGNFAFQMGREISRTKSKGFLEVSHTLAADTVDSGGGLCKSSAGPRGFRWNLGMLSSTEPAKPYTPLHRPLHRRNSISCEVIFAVVNFALGNFAGAPGFLCGKFQGRSQKCCCNCNPMLFVLV